jgi:hypothetical protein
MIGIDEYCLACPPAITDSESRATWRRTAEESTKWVNGGFGRPGRQLNLKELVFISTKMEVIILA